MCYTTRVSGGVISFALTIKRNVLRQLEERNIVLDFADKPARIIDRLGICSFQSVSQLMLIGATKAHVMGAQRNCDFDGSKFQ
jgi:hypothetical protein